MGGSNPEEQIGDVDQAGVVDQFDDSGVIEEVDNPETAREAKLFEISQKQCVWQDANEYSFRLRQTELLNFTIRVLARELCKDTENIDFEELHAKSMNYHNAFKREDGVHNWDILAKDPLFIPADREITFFAVYRDYFIKNAGASQTIHRDRFDQFLRQFIRLRDRLFQYLGKHCEKAD